METKTPFYRQIISGDTVEKITTTKLTLAIFSEHLHGLQEPTERVLEALDTLSLKLDLVTFGSGGGDNAQVSMFCSSDLGIKQIMIVIRKTEGEVRAWWFKNASDDTAPQTYAIPLDGNPRQTTKTLIRDFISASL